MQHPLQLGGPRGADGYLYICIHMQRDCMLLPLFTIPCWMQVSSRAFFKVSRTMGPDSSFPNSAHQRKTGNNQSSRQMNKHITSNHGRVEPQQDSPHLHILKVLRPIPPSPEAKHFRLCLFGLIWHVLHRSWI